MRLIDADKIRQKLNPDDWGTPDERWRPEREFGELIDDAPTVDQWHYPSKGELPEKSGEYLVKVNYHDGKTPAFMSICEFNTKYQSWCFCGNRDIVAWQYIVPPQEEVNGR